MKRLTKVSAILTLCVVLSIPMIVSAKVTESGIYWPSTISLTRDTIYARAESRGSIYWVESKAVFDISQGLPPLASNSGRYTSQINVARPISRYGQVANFAYYTTNTGVDSDFDSMDW